MPADWDLPALLHSVRTPLNSILLWVRLLKDGRTAPGEQARALDVIESSGLAIAQSLDELALLIRLKREPVDLWKLTAAAIDAERDQASRHGVFVESGDPGALPTVHADPLRLREVVRSLIAHAIDETPRGGRIRIGFEAEGSSVTLRIAAKSGPVGGSYWTLRIPAEEAPGGPSGTGVASEAGDGGDRTDRGEGA